MKKCIFIVIFFPVWAQLRSYGQEPFLMLPIGHTSVVKSAEFSPDGKEILSASWDNTIKLWDVETGFLVTDLTGSSQHFKSARFSKDGSLILAYDENSNKLTIWKTTAGFKPLDIQTNSSAIQSAEFSPDGLAVVSTSSDSVAKIWNTVNGKLLFTLNGHTDAINFSAFSPDGTLIITASADGSAKLWDAQSGKLLKEIKAKAGGLARAEFSKDGRRILITAESRVFEVWDASGEHLVARFRHPGAGELTVAASMDGRKLISYAGNDSVALVWDAEKATPLFSLRGDTSAITAAAFSADQKQIATLSENGTAKIWNAGTGRLEWTLAAGDVFSEGCANFSPDGKLLVTGTYRDLKIWDTETGNMKADLRGHTESIMNVQLLPDSQNIFVKYVGQDKYWDLKTGRPVDFFAKNPLYDDVIQFSPDEEHAIVNGYNGNVFIIDRVTGKRVNSLPGNGKKVNYAEYSRDGKEIVTASDDGIARLWDAFDGKLLLPMTGHTGPINSAKFSKDGKKVVTASNDGTAKIWDAVTGELLFNLVTDSYKVNSAEFSPDGRWVITASGYSHVQFWNALTGSLVSTSPFQSLTFAHFSADGRQVLAAYADNTVKIVDPATGNILANMAGHRSGILFAQFCDSGKKVVTASRDNTCKLWDAANGQLLYTMIAVDSADYLVTDPKGRYDGTTNAINLLYFTCGKEVISLDRVKDQLWIPGLAKLLTSGEHMQTPGINDLDICGLTPEVREIDSSGYHFIITPRSGGIGEAVLSVNGIEVRRFDARALIKSGNGFELTVAQAELQPYFIPGGSNPVTLKVYTQGSNIIPSRTARIIHQDKNALKAPNLYAVVIGVSNYKTEDMRLNYAAKDADDIAGAIRSSAGKLLGEDHVFISRLTTNENHDGLPVKASIRMTLHQIGARATAGDILLIFFAGHGVTSTENKQFYLLTAEASAASARDVPGAVGISCEELREWLNPDSIKAQKRVLILDACNSGAALKEMYGDLGTRGLPDDQRKAIDNLNVSSGMFVLAASASDQSAYEMSRYSQGLLTYSLLKAIKEDPAILDQGKFLDVSNWFNAAAKNVNHIVSESGYRQEPQLIGAGDFMIGIVDSGVMAGIHLANEKPLFIHSNFQNSDDAVADDDLGLNLLLDQTLGTIATRGENDAISYLPESDMPDAWSLSGRYTVNGQQLSLKINVKQHKAVKYQFEVNGNKQELQDLANRIIAQATTLISNAK